MFDKYDKDHKQALSLIQCKNVLIQLGFSQEDVEKLVLFIIYNFNISIFTFNNNFSS